MPGPKYATDLYYLAEENDGLFLASDARAQLGVPAAALVKMERRGVLERVARGVYRLTAYPPAPLAQYREAILAIRVYRPGLQAIVSHESALALHEISDVNPSKVRIT
ncbi:MAG TPA: type IV toxin-antitoxin system AbiEi family antitoxin domain-containing protein, partial [Candidatus Baltobacteraceae bacterium]|nr:type IV toxin-antitoxin system AbiEi family antitoxin domain-containing protein [Candidatus Baltobacteraceae bacterium]